jgi:hypothetical protein
MACAAQHFTGISPERFAALSQKAKGSGIDITGDSGTTTKFGVTVTWTYDPQAQELTIQCTEKPFFLSCDDINGRIQNAMTTSA